MDRVIRDGQVAVIYAPRHGAGWYSWHGVEELIFDPSIIAWLHSKELDKIKSYVTLKYPEKYFGELDNLRVQWVPVGTQFTINEYDGSETVVYKDTIEWVTA